MTLTADQVALELARACPAALGHLWQASIFGIAVAALTVSLRRAPARLRHSLYLLASAKFLLPSIVLAALTGFFLQDLSAPLPVWLTAALDPRLLARTVQGWFGATPGAGGAVPMAGGHWVWSFLVALWLGGVTMLLVAWGRRLYAFRSLLQRATPVTEGRDWNHLQSIRQRLGIRRPVTLWQSEELQEPGVWGVWRPRVILPGSMARELKGEEVEVVLLHELVHVHRWDNLVSHAHMALCCLFWFHPLVWWIDRRLLEERERACDDRVVELSGTSEVYARSLIKVLRLGLGWQLAGVSEAGGADLKARLEHIRAGAPVGVSPWHRVAVAVAFALLVCTSLAAVPFYPPAGEAEPIYVVTAEEAVARAGEDGDEIGACRLPDAPPDVPDCPHRRGRPSGGGFVRSAI